MRDKPEKILPCQTSSFTVYGILARINDNGFGQKSFPKIYGTVVTEVWKELKVDSDLIEIEGDLSYSSRTWAYKAAVCHELSGEMAGFIIHKLKLKYPCLEFRVIPRNVTLEWKVTSEDEPMYLDIGFKSIKEQSNDR